MTTIPTLLEMLKAGVHFGHRPTRWHPKMAPFIHGERGTVHVIDLEKTAEKLAEALAFVKELGAAGKTILFVGSKRQAREIVKREALRAGQPYVNERWLGGTLTNFGEISKLINSYRSTKKALEVGELDKYTKKEQLEFKKKLAKQDATLVGLEHMNRPPDALFIIDQREEKTAIREAKRIKTPVIAISDTNVNPEDVTHPIPANDDAVKSIDMITTLVADAMIEGKTEYEKNRAVEMSAVAAAAAAAKAASVQNAPRAMVIGESL